MFKYEVIISEELLSDAADYVTLKGVKEKELDSLLKITMKSKLYFTVVSCEEA